MRVGFSGPAMCVLTVQRALNGKRGLTTSTVGPADVNNFQAACNLNSRAGRSAGWGGRCMGVS